MRTVGRCAGRLLAGLRERAVLDLGVDPHVVEGTSHHGHRGRAEARAAGVRALEVAPLRGRYPADHQPHDQQQRPESHAVGSTPHWCPYPTSAAVVPRACARLRWAATASAMTTSTTSTTTTITTACMLRNCPQPPTTIAPCRPAAGPARPSAQYVPRRLRRHPTDGSGGKRTANADAGNRRGVPVAVETRRSHAATERRQLRSSAPSA